MSEEIGTVISGQESPSPSKLEFVVNKGLVHRGQFVEMDSSDGTLVALVVDVYKTNRYFERAESVKEFEASGRKMFEQFPTSEWEYLVAQSRLLGVYTNEGLIKRLTFPPSPGTRVRPAVALTMEKFLGFEKDGLQLGRVEHPEMPVELNMTRLLKKHLAILAMSGAGKSVASKVILEELLDRGKEKGRIAIVVMDPHGEYTSFAEPAAGKKSFKDYSSKTMVVKARDIRIGVPKISVAMIASIIPGLSATQRRELERILSRLKNEMRQGLGPFDLATLRNSISQDEEIKDATKGVLVSWIYSLEDLRLFSKTDSPSINDVVKQGKLTVVDLSEIVDMRKKQIIVSYFSSKLFNERRQARIPPFLLVIEEAHQFCPERTREEAAISKKIIETIAREGRKFGASLCLISQRPINLSTTALSQCNTHLILRVTNPYDLKHIGESSEGIDYKSQEMITSLKVGEALIVGEAVNQPVFFKVRKNKSAESKHEISLEEAALKFEEGKEKELKETEEFL
ncbi:MAG: hypothetical protein QT03_C0001G1180 [archaeon GW2011_AR10]|uniref:ATP-binding protein n=1 Tax=Candidatus Iainarchaeum sp. TaxID=3101447 RepID=A0A7J4IRQ9_9ARCH|nr:MAG: hypothetical protein QT03_C0001G1180 [archaeon GW2011_AR10]HIH08201.1 ATP-binding protein [Candidatus Diapherotrites archaeon]